MQVVIDYITEVITIIPIEASLVAIVGYLVWLTKHYNTNRVELCDRLGKVERLDKQQTEQLHELKQMTRRTMITNTNLPKHVRLDIYKEYKNEGGNSWIDEYVENNIK